MRKSLIALIAGAVSVFSILFLPLLSSRYESISLIDLMERIEYAPGSFVFFTISSLLLGGLLIVGSILRKKVMGFIGSIGALVSVFGLYGSFDASVDYMGAGMWLAIIGFIVSIVFVALDKE